MCDTASSAIPETTSEATPGTTATLPPPEEVRLLDVHTVAQFLSCSARHVYRLADSGRMPRPRKLGMLVRWDRLELEKWVADDCPTCQ